MRTLPSRLLAGLVALSVGLAGALVSAPALVAESPDAATTVDAATAAAAGAPSEVTSWAVAVLAAGVSGVLSNRRRRRA